MLQSPPSITVTTWVAVVLSFVLTLEGCSVGIAQKQRIGPDPARDFGRGASRAEVERKLEEPIATETLADGNVRVVYEYTARSGNSASWLFGPDGGNFLLADVRSLFLLELIFMPIAYFSKTKYTYRKEYVYGPDGTILEALRECLHDQSTTGPWDWCSQQGTELTVAERVTPAPEDKPAAPAPEP